MATTLERKRSSICARMMYVFVALMALSEIVCVSMPMAKSRLWEGYHGMLYRSNHVSRV